MKKLYAPWRNEYSISSSNTKSEDVVEKECVFCAQLEKNEDEKYFILKRGVHCAVLLNRYPYNAGHLLIVPFVHKPQLYDLIPEARAEMIELLSSSITILKDELKPNGFNSGLNLGIAAGGSIPSHLHMHLLPRWAGDTNFLLTVGDTKVVSFDLHQIYNRIKPAFSRLAL